MAATYPNNAVQDTDFDIHRPGLQAGTTDEALLDTSLTKKSFFA